jgi:site-specific recombinase XerC
LLRTVLRSIELRLDGERAASNTIRIKRGALRNALDFAVEKKLLTANPMNEVKTKKRKFELRQVDPSALVDPVQARMLLDAVRTVGKQGPPLVALFGLMYYTGLRARRKSRT